MKKSPEKNYTSKQQKTSKHNSVEDSIKSDNDILLDQEILPSSMNSSNKQKELRIVSKATILCSYGIIIH